MSDGMEYHPLYDSIYDKKKPSNTTDELKAGDRGMSEGKLILDPCCGARMMWFDKNNPNVLFADCREIERRCIWEGKNGDKRFLEVKPDKIIDFRKMEFKDKSFKLVVFDPPHVTHAGKNSWLFAKYGSLEKQSWKEDLTKGFNECWRVLEDFGILIFKWSESDIKLSEVLKLFEQKPLFGHRSGKSGNTIWLCFMKIKKSN